MISKNLIYISALALTVYGVSFLRADAPKAVADAKPMVKVEEMKICFVDTQKIMGESEVGKKETAALQAEFKKLGTELQKMQQELAQAASDWEAKKATANELTREKTVKQLTKMERDYKIRAEECDQEFRSMQQKAAERVTKQVDQVIADHARKTGYDAALCKVTGRVIYASEKTDCTNDIIAAMNKTFPAATTVAKATTTAKTTA